jgi:hypothetical protein
MAGRSSCGRGGSKGEDEAASWQWQGWGGAHIACLVDKSALVYCTIVGALFIVVLCTQCQGAKKGMLKFHVNLHVNLCD